MHSFSTTREVRYTVNLLLSVYSYSKGLLYPYLKTRLRVLLNDGKLRITQKSLRMVSDKAG